MWFLCQDDPSCSYPSSIFLVTLAKSFFTAALFCMVWQKIINFFIAEKISPYFFTIIFSPIILLFFGFKILVVLQAMVALSMLLIAFSNRIKINYNYLSDAIFFLLIFCALGIFCEIFSPFYERDQILTAKDQFYYLPQLSVVGSLIKGFIWVKYFSFSHIDYSQWAGIMNTFQASPLLQITTLVLDLPSVDINSFYKVLYSIIFVLCLIGSFGFYLLLYRGLGLNRGLALFGGIAYIICNPAFFINISLDGHFFISSYCLLPLALFFLIISLKKNSDFYALLAGVTLFSQFIFLAPHPEGTIYTAATYAVIGFFYAAFQKDLALNFKRRFVLFSLSILSFGLFSLIYFAPLLNDILRGVTHIYGHAPRFSPLPDFDEMEPYAEFAQIGIYITFYRLIIKKKFDSFIWGTIFLSIFLILILLTGQNGFISKIIPLNVISYHRIYVILVAMSLVIGLYGINSVIKFIADDIPIFYHSFREKFNLKIIFSAENLRQKISQFFEKNKFAKSSAILALNILIALTCFGLSFFPFEKLSSYKDCPYYITLESNLANYQGMRYDQANIGFIKNRIIGFESDLNKRNIEQVNKYSTPYRELLRNFSVISADQLSDDQVVKFSENFYKIIDGFYLDKKFNCVSEKIHPPVYRDSKTLKYNLDGIYFNSTNAYERIMSSGLSDIAQGTGHGLLMHNNTSTLDSRFMMGYPTLHALYSIPKYYYTKRGSYNGIYAWHGIDLNWKNLKLLNISGIDIITIWKGFPYYDYFGLTALDFDQNKIFDYNKKLLLLRNENSYHQTYIANSANFVAEKSVKNVEKKIVNYFHKKIGNAEYVKAVRVLEPELQKLKNRFDVIVEKEDLYEKYRNNKRDQQEEAKVQNIAGDRLFIKANCAKEQCLLGLNLAKFPDWKAYVNGKRKEIYRVNLAFMGVEIPKGESSILFIYENYFIDLIFILGIILFMCLLHYEDSTLLVKRLQKKDLLTK